MVSDFFIAKIRLELLIFQKKIPGLARLTLDKTYNGTPTSKNRQDVWIKKFDGQQLLKALNIATQRVSFLSGNSSMHTI